MNSSPQAVAGGDGSALRRQALGESCAAPVRASRRRWRGCRKARAAARRPAAREVAQLCGISVTWYTWIEQGREVSVSPSVWSRIAGVLQLARAERAYLFELADCADPQPPRDAGGAPGPLRACVDAIRAPAYVLDRAWNLLAWNEPLRELFDDWPCAIPRPICCAISSWTRPRANWWWIGSSARVAWWPSSAPTRARTWTSPPCWRWRTR